MSPDAHIAPSLPLRDGDLVEAADFTAALKPPLSRFVLRGPVEAAERAGRAFGTPIPGQPLASTAHGSRLALWLGPDEWLLLADRSEGRQVEQSLEAALSNTPHSLVDVSHRQLALGVSGRLAARVLTSGCPLDLSLWGFPIGMAARTLFHKAEIVLLRQAADAFHVEV